MKAWHIILLSALGLSNTVVIAGQVLLPTGKSQFEFVDQKGDPARPINVWMFVPKGCDIKCPMQFVMHGVKRDGENYLDNWVEFANARKFIVVTPEFTRKHFPRDDDYSLGRSSTEPDPAKWTFAVPEHLFDELKARYGFTAQSYRMFGHSAGGQFVHRMHLFNPSHRADPIVAANPGWYTMPQWGIGTTKYKFPHNTIDSRIDAARAKAALQRPFYLMLGTRDTDPNDPNLNRSAGAMEQGRNRVERGERFFAAAMLAAKNLGAEFKWDKIHAENIGHESVRMAAIAVQMMYDPLLSDPAYRAPEK